MQDLDQQTHPDVEEFLDQEALFAACRIIYDLAGDHYVLPPLIRDVQEPQPHSKSVYTCHAGDRDIYFHVALDTAYADRNARPNSRLPLKFHAQLRRHECEDRTIELTGRQKNELVRAFLLGMKAPLAAEEIEGESGLRLSIQLASTFFVECGAVGEVSAGSVPGDICNRVGERLYERSREFLPDRKAGIELWSGRAAQDLFGEAKPKAETFWPIAKASVEHAAPVLTAPVQTGDIALPRTGAPRARAGAGWLRSRYAVAAALITGLLFGASVGMSLTLRMTPAASVEPALSPGPHVLVAVASERLNALNDIARPESLTVPALVLDAAPILAPVFIESVAATQRIHVATLMQAPGTNGIDEGKTDAAPARAGLVVLAAATQATAGAPAVTSDATPIPLVRPKPPGVEKIAERRPAKPAPAAQKTKAQTPANDLTTSQAPRARPRANDVTPWARRAVVNVRNALRGIGKIPLRIASLVKAPSPN